MQTQNSELTFKGQRIFVGIDVHLKSWTVTVLSESLAHKTFTQPASHLALHKYLTGNFPQADYYSVYEAGFCGFMPHYRLQELGIKNIVINPADVPTTQKEHLQKDDPTDSRKLARSLRSGELTGIYIPLPANLGDRTLVRIRASIVSDMVRFKQRIKSFLNFYGITYPEEFKKTHTHWSNQFMKWLRESVVLEYETDRQSLQLLLQQADHQRARLLEVTKKIKELSSSQKYEKNMKLLRSVPGIGLITAITLLTEIEDISRFPNSDHFAGFIGLVPNRHSSGESTQVGEMTFRGQTKLKKLLIESSWVAARLDPALLKCFNQYVIRMDKNKAIVKIARKVLNRIYFVLKNKMEYVPSVIK